MAIDDELAKSELRAKIAEQARRSTQEIIVNAQFAGVLALFPVVGNIILEAQNRLTTKWIYQRLEEMNKEWDERFRKAGEATINMEWFQSAEFQVLLSEAIHQLYTAQDREKIKMLGNALANSGISTFSQEDRKELFIRLVRDLTPRHVAMLKSLYPEGPRLAPKPPESSVPDEEIERMRWLGRPTVSAREEDSLVLQLLVANGLVSESLELKIDEPSYRENSISSVDRAIAKFVKQVRQPPKHTFRLGPLGRDFLRFMGLA
jgi:hypothetical protein